MTPRFLACAAALLLTACPKAPPTSIPSSEQQALEPLVHDISAKAERALRQQQERVWTHWVEGGAMERVASDGQSGWLQPDAVLLVEKARRLHEQADPTSARALQHLKLYLAGEHLAQVTWELNEATAHLESSLTFQAHDRENAYRDLERLLTNERSAHRRKVLYGGASIPLVRLNKTLERKQALSVQTLQRLGYADEASFGVELRGMSAEELEALAQSVLTATEALYRHTLEQRAPSELGIPANRLCRADLPRLFRLPSVDFAFPPERALPRVSRTLDGMGIDLSSLQGFRVHSVSNPTSVAGALLVPIAVPSDVRLSINPVGGLAEQSHLFHEIGHGLHHVLTAPMRFELTQLGNLTVSEAHAVLLESLLLEPSWLSEHVGADEAGRGELIRTMSANRLYRIRLAAARLAYQLARHQQPEREPQTMHRQLVQHLLVGRLPEDDVHYLLDSEVFFQPADELRAWILAAQLRASLKHQFGEAWWNSPKAGERLRGLWARGNSLSVRDFANQFHGDPLDPGALVSMLAAGLQTPTAAPSAIRDGGEWTPKPWATPHPPPGPADGGT